MHFRPHLHFTWMDSYLVQRGLATGLQSLPRSLPVRNQRGSQDVHRVALWLLFLCFITKLPGGASSSHPSAFWREQEGERDSTQASTTSEPRSRAEDTAS